MLSEAVPEESESHPDEKERRLDLDTKHVGVPSNNREPVP
jgi:hypothetical protein